MAQLTEQQLASFNGNKGFIIILQNEATETRLLFDNAVFIYGQRYPPNDPKISGVSLDQRGNGPIFHYFSVDGYCLQHVKGAIGYRISLNDAALPSLYLYVGFNIENVDETYGFYVSLKENWSESELRKAAHEASETGSVDYPFRGRWKARVDYENYRNATSVKQIRVKFSRITQPNA